MVTSSIAGPPGLRLCCDSGSRVGRGRSLFLVLVGLLGPVTGIGKDARIETVTTNETGMTVTLNGFRTPEFLLEDRAVDAAPVTGPGGGSTWHLAGRAASGERLIVRDSTGDAMALRPAVDDERSAPFNDWVIYHIMVAYFGNGGRDNDASGLRKWMHTNYAGGDLQGILNRVDYLSDLGVNAVWLSPIFASETSHGYDITNYYNIGDAVAVPKDPDASRALYDELVASLHAKNIKVILDMPLDYGSGAYDRRKGDPHELRPRSTGPKQEAEKMWESWGTDFRYWNFDDQNTRDFLTRVSLHWLNQGRADGLRLDYVRGVPHDYWAELYAAVKAAKPESFLFGEAWQDAAAVAANALDIAKYYEPIPGTGPQFDGLLEYPLQMVMTDVFARDGMAEDLESWLQRTAALYGRQGRPVYFLDNHDVSRFLSWAVDSPDDRLLAAVGFMAALSSPMILYYGTETGLTGGRAKLGFVDDGRVAMPWKNLDQALIDRISELLRLRATYPALPRGGRLPVHADNRTLIMRKTHPDGDVLVGVNASKKEAVVTLPASRLPEDCGAIVGLVAETLPTCREDGTVSWALPAHSTSWVALGGR